MIDGEIGHYNSVDELYEAAIGCYGSESQTLMFIEEASELTKELLKHINRGANNDEQILEEIADVEICLEQLKYMYDFSNHVSTYKERKLARLADRMAQEN